MMGTVIEKSKDKMEKRETYAGMFRKYNLAVKQGFYLEAVFIIYAMLEDRINSFLLYSGLVSYKKDKLKLSSGAAGELASELYWRGKNHNSDSRVNLSMISNRIELLKNLTCWTEETERTASTKKYDSDLMDQMIGSVDLYEMKEVLGQIVSWKHVRNECVHALMNKNFYSEEQKTQDLADQGIVLVRRMDDLVKKFKKNNHLRKKYNIQPVTW